MKNKYFYPIYKLKIKSWIKYWLIKQTEFKGVLSDILEGISFYLTDSLNMKFKMFDIIGRTTQESTTGNQLINFASPTSMTNVTVTFTNDVLTVVGTSGNYIYAEWDILDLLKNNAGKTLKIKFENINVSGGQGGIVQMQIINNGTTAYPSLVNREGAITANYTIPADISGLTLAKFRIYTNSTGSGPVAATVTITKPLVYFNNNDTYEPYTGGEPAPNPIYPFPIKNTGDNGSVNENVSNSDGTQEQNISFPLAEGQKLMQGDYPDDDEKVHHKWGEYVLDGTVGGYNAEYNWFYISKENITSNVKSFELLSNYFKNIVYASFESDNTLNGITWNSSILNNVTHLLIRNTNCTNATEYKIWLAEVLPKVQFPLAEETTEDFTEEQKTAWEQIKKARTYKNVTHISSEDETPALLKIQYWKEG